MKTVIFIVVKITFSCRIKKTSDYNYENCSIYSRAVHISEKKKSVFQL